MNEYCVLFKKVISGRNRLGILNQEGLKIEDLAKTHYFEKRTNKKQVWYVKANWKKLYSELKEEGYTISEISKKIDHRFSNQVQRGDNLRLEKFRKLQKIYKKEIDFDLIKTNRYF